MNLKVYTWKLWNRRAFLIALVIPVIFMVLLEMLRAAVLEALDALMSTFYQVADVYRALWNQQPAKVEPDELKNEDSWGNC